MCEIRIGEKVRGQMKMISLTQDQVAIVDDEDYDDLSMWKWYADWCPGTKSFYVKRMSRSVNGKPHSIQMHREIFGLKRDDKRQCDHKNHDTLDNRRENLRIVTLRENHANRRDQSKYGVGVSRDLRRKRCPFHARINLRGERHYIGVFATAVEAREAILEFLEKKGS